MLCCTLLLGFLQTVEMPPLPPPLDQNVEAAAAVQALSGGFESEQARAAAAEILGLLGQAEPVAQANFLVQVVGHEAFPKNVGITAAWRRLSGSWPELEGWLMAALLRDEDRFELNGALAAIGYLELSNPTMIEATAARLSEERSAEYVRRALFNITRHEFPDAGAFNSWWATARQTKRAAWIAQAFDAAHAREIKLWGKILALDPGAALEAGKSPLRGVRKLAFGTMAEYPQVVEGDYSPAAEALRDAFYQESDPELRRDLISLIPRFHLGAEAMSLLDQALEASAPGERLAAARSLIHVRPVELARVGVVRHLRRVYVQEEGVGNRPEFRSALWNGLREVAEAWSGGDADNELSLVLVRALDREPNQQTRNDVYKATGALGWPQFMEVLLPRANDDELTAEERSSAMAAMTSIAVAGGEREQLLEILHRMLNHHELRYRSVQCLRDLKDQRSASPLAIQLAYVEEDFVLRAILAALAELPRSADAIKGLLAYRPAAEFEDDYVKALASQVGTEDSDLVRSVATGMEKKDMLRIAFRLLDGFPRTELAAASSAALERDYARVLAKWLLQAELDGGQIARAEDALARLAQLEEDEPKEGIWPFLQVKLSLKLERPDDADVVLQRLFDLIKAGGLVSPEIQAELPELAAVIRPFGETDG